mmetsp:Transcript_42501/g.112515  ORF Transcript_42501/g.112515 Transcript_42501/m.112515 type:complete len:223 (+) Transcript_42501:180-848(+)
MPGKPWGIPGKPPGMPGMPRPGMPGGLMPGIPGKPPPMAGHWTLCCIPGMPPGMPGMVPISPGMPGMPGRMPGRPWRSPGGSIDIAAFGGTTTAAACASAAAFAFLGLSVSTSSSLPSSSGCTYSTPWPRTTMKPSIRFSSLPSGFPFTLYFRYSSVLQRTRFTWRSTAMRVPTKTRPSVNVTLTRQLKNCASLRRVCLTFPMRSGGLLRGAEGERRLGPSP